MINDFLIIDIDFEGLLHTDLRLHLTIRRTKHLFHPLFALLLVIRAYIFFYSKEVNVARKN